MTCIEREEVFICWIWKHSLLGRGMKHEAQEVNDLLNPRELKLPKIHKASPQG